MGDVIDEVAGGEDVVKKDFAMNDDLPRDSEQIHRAVDDDHVVGHEGGNMVAGEGDDIPGSVPVDSNYASSDYAYNDVTANGESSREGDGMGDGYDGADPADPGEQEHDGAGDASGYDAQVLGEREGGYAGEILSCDAALSGDYVGPNNGSEHMPPQLDVAFAGEHSAAQGDNSDDHATLEAHAHADDVANGDGDARDDGAGEGAPTDSGSGENKVEPIDDSSSSLSRPQASSNGGGESADAQENSVATVGDTPSVAPIAATRASSSSSASSKSTGGGRTEVGCHDAPRVRPEGSMHDA